MQALIFAIFPVICKYKFPQTKVAANILPQRNLLNLPPKNTVLRNCVFSIKTCLFCSETKRSTMKNWFYIGYAYCSIVSKYVFPLHILNEKQKYYQYWVQDFIKTTKNNSWKEKSICSNLQKLVPAKHYKLPNCKNKLLQTFRATPYKKVGSLCSDKKKIEFQLVLLTKVKKCCLPMDIYLHLFVWIPAWAS